MPNTANLERIKYEFHDGNAPYISLKPGAAGTIEKVELNPAGDCIIYEVAGRKHKLDLPIDSIRRVSLWLGHGRSIPGELEKCTQEELEKMNVFGLPVDDLEHIRLLEQCLRGAIEDYRNPKEVR